MIIVDLTNNAIYQCIFLYLTTHKYDNILKSAIFPDSTLWL